MRILNLLTGSILLFPLSLSVVHAQSSSPTTSSPTSGTAAISGSDWSASEVTSKADEMPTFKGFDSLDRSNFVGRAASNSTFVGRGNSSSPLRTSSGSTRRTSSTTSRSTSRSTANRGTSTANRNRTMTGSRSGTGANTNNITTLTQLGYDLQPSSTAEISANRVRVTKIENGINNYGKIQTVLPVTVEVDDKSTALIRGAVQTQNDRRLVENYVKLHGIKTVKNELVCTENSL